MNFFGDDFLLPMLVAISATALLFALAHAHAGVRHARARRRLRATHRFAWMSMFLLVCALSGGGALTLRGYRLLAREIDVATISARQVAPQQFAVRADFPDGTHTSGELRVPSGKRERLKRRNP